MAAYLRAGRGRGVVRPVPEILDVPDDAAELRAANARLRELLAHRDAEIAVLREHPSRHHSARPARARYGKGVYARVTGGAFPGNLIRGSERSRPQAGSNGPR